jgi:hypothetical protein
MIQGLINRRPSSRFRVSADMIFLRLRFITGDTENLTQRRKGAKVKTDGIAAKRRKKENESRITGVTGAL